MPKKPLLTLALLIIFSPFFVLPASAGFGWDNKANDIQATTGLGNTEPQIIAANIINIVLGFLGILSVCLILFAGFKWMTAAGNEERVNEAKKLLVAAVIGLLIILAAYAIAAFVLGRIYAATT